ncbi:MAG: WD40/YVTN/BNR-like repeat-containing protein, partial [Terracidiphilus sp.]
CSSAPQLLFAGTWNSHRPPWSTYASLDGPGGGLYRSQDAGKTWSRLEGHGLPEGDWGRVGVEVAPDGKRVYALIEAKPSEAKKSGLYRSDDGGNTWVLANADPRLTSRAWYFNRVTVDPQNPDVLYVPNIALYRSEDGGKTISVLRGAPGGDDYHQLWIDPRNSASMVLGTDQGTTISLNRGQTWSSWYNQPTAQFYHVTTDNQFPYVVYGAQQDTGAAAVVSRTDHGQITPRDWFPAGPSESGYLVVDPKNPDIIYLSGTFGTVARFNKRTGLSQDITPWPAMAWDAEIHERKYRAPWTPPLVLSPADATTLYLGTQYVMKTVDGGLHWETISPDLTGATGDGHEGKDKKAPSLPTAGPPTIEEAKRAGYGVVFTIAPSLLNRDLIWAGSDTGLIHITRDGGKSWKDVTPPGLSDWSKISLIEASHFDPAVAYAAVDRGRLDDQAPYIYRTRDYGASWQLVTNGLAAPAFLRAVREDPESRGLLFAGTEFGVYVSFDDGDHWQSLQLNLPVSSIRDLAINGDDLVVATHGRAFWILDNITPLRQALQARKARGPWLYRPATAVRVDNDFFTGTPLPPEEPTAENPPNGAVIDYFLPSTVGSVRLEIFDAQQNLVRRFSSEDASGGQRTPKHRPLPIAERWFPKPEVIEKTAGMHRFVWNLAWGSSGGPDVDEDSEYRNPSGPKVVPGIYQVRLTVDGRTQEQSLKVIMDPRSAATAEVLAQQLQLGQQIFGETIEARRALAEIGSVQKQLADIQQKLGQQKQGAQSAQLKSALTEVQSEIGKILTNKEHAAAKGPGLQDAYTGLASALRVVEYGERAVPSQAIAVYRESSQQVKARIAEWAGFKQTKLAQLNQQLREANFAPIAISAIEEEVEFMVSG